MNKKALILAVVCIATVLTAFNFIKGPEVGHQQTRINTEQGSHTEHDEACGCGHDAELKPTAVTAAENRNITRAIAGAKGAARGFEQWLEKEISRATGKVADAQTITHGVALAKQRKEAMLVLMVEAPEQALASALSWAEYKALPRQVREHVETPFSERGDFMVLPNCGMLDGSQKGFQPDNHQVELSSGEYRSTAFGRRENISSKQNTPLQGICLNGVAVVRAEPLQKLSRADVEAVGTDFPVANKDRTRDFSTGQKISGDPLVALGGGKLFFFANEAELQNANEKLAELDELPGPHSGAQVIFLQASAVEGEEADVQGLDWSQLEASAQFQADTWTETKKTAFFIRVDFSDNTGESTSQATLANVMNTAVSDSIEEMSYGKTWIEAEVSSMVVRLPSPTTTYLPNNNTLLRDNAMAAFDALNTGINLGDYDIVGVHFKSIGMSSGGLTYAGLAGGDRQWLQGTTSSNVIIHEFGHNYGLGHARFWDTSGASVVGAGSTEEYGNDFDIMGSGPDPEGHFHPQAKAKLSWLDGTDWIDTAVSGSDTYRLYRGDHEDTTGVRGLRVPKDSGIDHYYWVGYRRAITTNEYLLGGVVVNWEKDGTSWLIDTTPGSTADKEDSGVLVGKTYSDTTAGVHVTPVAQGGTSPNEWVDVTVNIGAFPGNAAPTATLSGASSGTARTDLAFSVSANDANGDTLAYSWDFGDGATSLNQSAVTYSWSYGGTYTVKVTVTDMKGGTVTKTMSVTITDPISSWTVGNVGQTQSMSKAAYINGRYILTGNRYAYFSLDGVNWTNQDLALNFRAGGTAFGNEKYVIAGYDWNGSAWVATAYHSNDGKIWTSATVPVLESMNDVAFGSGRFVAVGDSGNVMYSTDGESWTAGTAPGSEDLDGVSFANGEFIAVGDNKVYASSNGVTWVDRSSSTGLSSWHSFRDILYTGGKFYAGGWYSGIRYSSDQGVTWQAAVMPSGVDYDIRSISVDLDEGLLVAVAERRSDNTGVILISTDGLSWNEGVPTNFVYTSTLTFGNGLFLSTQGSSGATQYSGAIYTTNQAPTTSVSGGSSADAREVVQFTSTSNDADGDELIHIWDFQDGTDLVTGTSAYHSFPTGGTYTVKLTVVDRRGGLVTDTLVVTVTDPLNNWTQRTSGTTADLYDVVVGGGKLVAVGSGSGTYRVSTDAVSWSGGTVGVNIRLTGVIYDGSQFVASGYDYNFGISAWVGVIYTSPDGTTWTRRHFGGEELNDVAYAGGAFVAVGDSGTLLRSTDGLTWSGVTSGVTTNLHGVSYGDGGFVVVGANSSSQGATILKSTDGLAWMNTSSGAGTGQGFFHTEYLNDLFLATGFYTGLRYSTDNGDTFTNTQLGDMRSPAMAYGNGIYFAAGFDYTSGNPKRNLLSTDGKTWSDLTTTASVDRNAAVFFQNTFITVGDAGEIWQSDPIPAPSGWSIWQAEQFPGYPPLSGAYDDYDGDGVDNLLEYIFGTDAKDATSYSTASLTEESGYMTLTVNKASAISGFDLVIEASTDLSAWDTTGLVIVVDNETTLKVRLAHLTTDPSVGRKFLRARATVSP